MPLVPSTASQRISYLFSLLSLLLLIGSAPSLLSGCGPQEKDPEGAAGAPGISFDAGEDVTDSSVTQQVAKPVFSVPGGQYATSQTIEITASTPGVSIFLALDGTDPTSSSTEYSAPIELVLGQTAKSTTIKAIGVAPGFLDSPIAAETYDLEPIPESQTAAPSFHPPAGSYSTPPTVVISSSTEGAVVRYTLDGTNPTAQSPSYSSPIQIVASTEVRAISTAVGLADSPISSAAYSIAPSAAIPTFDPPPGFFTSILSVTILSATPGAAIYYTTDGSEPNHASALFTAPLVLASNTTLRALAAASNLEDSEVAAGVYLFSFEPPAQAPTFAPEAGTYPTPQEVTISSSTPGSEVRYTIDCTEPTQSSTLYAGPVLVSSSLTLKAFVSAAPNWDPSLVATAVYEIQ